MSGPFQFGAGNETRTRDPNLGKDNQSLSATYRHGDTRHKIAQRYAERHGERNRDGVPLGGGSRGGRVYARVCAVGATVHTRGVTVE